MDRMDADSNDRWIIRETNDEVRAAMARGIRRLSYRADWSHCYAELHAELAEPSGDRPPEGPTAGKAPPSLENARTKVSGFLSTLSNDAVRQLDTGDDTGLFDCVGFTIDPAIVRICIRAISRRAVPNE